MKSNLLNKVEPKMILIILIIITCIYYVITSSNEKEGYRGGRKSTRASGALTYRQYRNLSPENQERYRKHHQDKIAAVLSNKDMLDQHLNRLDYLRFPFYRSPPSALELAEYGTQYGGSYWLNTDNVGINQLLSFQYIFDNAKQPVDIVSPIYLYSKFRGRIKNKHRVTNYGNLQRLLHMSKLGHVEYVKNPTPVRCNRGYRRYNVYKYCKKPNMNSFMFNNITEILENYYSYQEKIAYNNYYLVLKRDPTQYGGEPVSSGGFIYALQQFIFSWEKFKLLYINWLYNNDNNIKKYRKVIFVFDTISIQAFKENNEELLNKKIEGLQNVFTVARYVDTINSGNDTITILDVIRQAVGKVNKPIDFIEEEFKDLLKQFLYLGMTFKDILPTRNSTKYAKISDKLITDLNESEYEKTLIDTFGDLSEPKLKNDITYTFIEEKADDSTNSFSSWWQKINDTLICTRNKMYFEYPYPINYKKSEIELGRGMS